MPADPPVEPAPAPAGGPVRRPPRRLRSFLIGSVIALALAVFLFVGLGRSSGSGSGGGPLVGIGDQAPGFSLPSLTGGPAVALDALGKDRHHPVVLNFFASWCIPCRQETPLLARTATAEQAKGSGVQFVGVDVLDPDVGTAVSFVQKAGLTYPVGRDAHASVTAGLYALDAEPNTYFIDSSGRVVGHKIGALDQAELTGWLRRLGASSG